MGGVLVGGEAAPACCYLEEHAARLPEVDGAEVVAVNLGRHPEPRLPYPLAPGPVLLIVRCPKSHVVHASAPQVRPGGTRVLNHPHHGPWSTRPDLEYVDPRVALLVLPR